MRQKPRLFTRTLRELCGQHQAAHDLLAASVTRSLQFDQLAGGIVEALLKIVNALLPFLYLGRCGSLDLAGLRRGGF